MVLYFICQNERVHSPSDCSLVHPRDYESALTTWVKALPGKETHLLAVALGEVDDEAARRWQRHQRPRVGAPQLRVDRRRLVKSVERRGPPHRRGDPWRGRRWERSLDSLTAARRARRREISMDSPTAAGKTASVTDLVARKEIGKLA
jgi:hypothetical protein